MEIRLEKLVRERFALTYRRSREAISRGQIDVAGKPCVDPALLVDPEATIEFRPNRPRPDIAARKLSVLYEDRHILIVDKPAGVLTQPTPAKERDTLLERAGRYLVRKHGIAKPYVGIVHRLDRDTSGAILLVCSPSALRPFHALFRDHAIERLYLAFVEGVIEPTRGTIDLPLVADRGDGRRGTAAVGAHGTPAVTHYERLSRFGTLASEVACRLETGRTHQIRIHLAELGHPVIGDQVYQRRPTPWLRHPPVFPVSCSRQALHAQALGFIHPMTGDGVRVEAPLPADLADLAAVLSHLSGGGVRG